MEQKRNLTLEGGLAGPTRSTSGAFRNRRIPTGRAFIEGPSILVSRDKQREKRED